MYAIVLILIAYLLGAVNFSFLYGRLFKGIDIRNHGSGNAGQPTRCGCLAKGRVFSS
jgi:glycerol-3-phosphate acyltransferase PlsY